MKLEYNLNFISDKSKKSSIKKALTILERSYARNTEESSFFLDPFEQKVIANIAEKNNIKLDFIGGNDLAERKIFVSSSYNEVDQSDYISILEFDHENLSHPDVLGALMSLNLDRETIGDIVINDNICQMAVLNKISNFIRFNLNKIKRESINVRIKEKQNFDIKPLTYINHRGFVASTRLDILVAEFINLSRSKAKEIIKSKNVKVNFEMIDNPSRIIDENSMISIRKYGRFIFEEITGKSKKGNFHITYKEIRWYIY